MFTFPKIQLPLMTRPMAISILAQMWINVSNPELVSYTPSLAKTLWSAVTMVPIVSRYRLIQRRVVWTLWVSLAASPVFSLISHDTMVSSRTGSLYLPLGWRKSGRTAWVLPQWVHLTLSILMTVGSGPRTFRSYQQ